MFVGFVKFEIKQWLLAYQEQFCAYIVSLDSRLKLLEYFF